MPQTQIPKSFVPDDPAQTVESNTAQSNTMPASFVPDTVSARAAPKPNIDMQEVSTYGFPLWDETVEQTSKLFSALPDMVRKASDSMQIMNMGPDRVQNPVQTSRTAAKDLAYGLVEPAKHHLFDDPDAGVFERLWNTGIAYLGGDPDSAKKYAASGDPERASAAYLSMPLMTLGLGKLLNSVPGLKDTNVPVTGTRQEISALADIISKGVRESDPHTVAQVLQPLYKQSAQELGKDPIHQMRTRETAPQTDIVGNLRRDAQDAMDISSHAVDISERPLNAAMQVYGHIKVPEIQKTVADSLRNIASTFDNKDGPLATAIRGVARDIEVRGGTVGGLNELKAHANKEMNKLFGASTGQQIAASAQSSYAYRLMADEIRANLYPAIKEMGGPDLGAFGAREAAAIQGRDGAFGNYYKRVSPAQASHAAQTYLEYVSGGSLYEMQLKQRALGLRPTPMGQFNKLFRRGVGEIGEGMVPEKVTTTPTTFQFDPIHKMLSPPPGAESIFTIKGEPVIRQLQQLDLVDAPSKPLPATKTGLDYGGGRYSDETQNWQFTGEAATDPLRRPSGAGSLRTNDPAVVQRTISSIQERLKQFDNDPFKPPPVLKQQLLEIQTDLINQLQAYQKSMSARPKVQVTPGTVTVDPMKPGTRTSSTAKGRYGAPLAMEIETSEERRAPR